VNKSGIATLKLKIQQLFSPKFSQLSQLECAPVWSQNSQPLLVGQNVLPKCVVHYN
jgi:hypothetical protein